MTKSKSPQLFSALVLCVAVASSAAAESCFHSEHVAFAPGEVSDEAQSLGAEYLAKVQDGEAIGWYRQAELFFHEKSGVPRDDARASTCLEAAVLAGYTDAYYLWGLSLQREGRGEEALFALEKAMEFDPERAGVQLAYGHLLNRFGTKSDPKLGYELTLEYAAEGNTRAAYFAASAKASGSGTTPSEREGFEEMLRLAQDGYPPAMDRVGRAYTFGIGTARDLDLAIEWYERAIAAEYPKSNIGLGTALYRKRAYAESIRIYERAIDENIADADYYLAVNHAQRRFGPLSQPSDGWESLVAQSLDGNLRSSQSILAAFGQRNNRDADLDFIRAQLQQATYNGDMRSAEALIRFFRERPDLTVGAAQKRRTLLDQYGREISESAWNRELIHDKIAEDPLYSFSAMSKILANSSSGAYVDTLFEIRRVSPNAFVFAFQNELARIDAFSVRRKGILNSSTLKKLLEICAQNEREAECRTSPLGYDTVRIIGEHLSSKRPAG